MKTFLRYINEKVELEEDGMGGGAIGSAGPTNVTGSGKVAGMGQPPGSQSGEPGVNPKKKRKIILAPTFRRNPPQM